MKSPAWRPSKNKLSKISGFSLLVFGLIYGAFLVKNFSGTEAATAMCYGHPGVHTLVAPASVTPGQSFKLTNVTGSANSSIATVHSVTLTLKVTNASPSSVSRTWNGGPVSGDYTSTYSDISLTAGQAVGSQITVALDSIAADVTIAGVDTTITCSVDNGQLTANNPGETLNLAAVPIVAPATEQAASPTKTSTKSTTPSSQTTTTTDQMQSSSSPATPAEATPVGQDMNVTVTDNQGKPVRGANVVLDSLPAVSTDASGKAIFKLVNAGKHNLSITARGHTITKAVDLQLNPGTVMGVHVQLPAPSHMKRNIAIGLVGLLLFLIGFAVWFRRRRRTKNWNPPASPQLTPGAVPPDHPVTIVNPSNQPAGSSPNKNNEAGP